MLDGQAWALSPEQVFARASQSVVVVEVEKDGEEIGSGSGVIIGPSEAVTNCHVVEKGDAFFVAREGKRIRAVLVDENPSTDLCALRFRPGKPFHVPISGAVHHHSLAVGQRVYAIGAPRGLELTMSSGIVSAIRTISDELTLVQTDAAISPGSSGGGLFDEQARLVGITTFLIRESQNLNFALTATLVMELQARRGLPVAPQQVAPQATDKAAIEEEKRRIEAIRREQTERERALAEREAQMREERRRQEEEYARRQKELAEREAALRAGEQQRSPKSRSDISRDGESSRQAPSRTSPGESPLTSPSSSIETFSEGIARRFRAPPARYASQRDRRTVLRIEFSSTGVPDPLTWRLVESSGDFSYDDAVLKAVLGSQASVDELRAYPAVVFVVIRTSQGSTTVEVGLPPVAGDASLNAPPEPPQSPEVVTFAIPFKEYPKEPDPGYAEDARRAEEARRREEQRQAVIAQQRAADELREARERAETARRASAEAASVRRKAINEYTALIRNASRDKLVIPPGIEGNPQAEFEVTLLRNGAVASVRMVRSSGVRAYDRAVERAIDFAQPLPVPDDVTVFDQIRELKLIFRPRD
ncbi:MAG: TonB family protein [Rhodobacter sp.]|nr:TonB family protein [Rhodobacter sp.]